MPSLRKKPAAIGIKAAYPSFIEPALATSARWSTIKGLRSIGG